MADAMLEEAHPHADTMRDTDLLGNYREQWFCKKYPHTGGGRDFRTFPPGHHQKMIEDSERGIERPIRNDNEIVDSHNRDFLTDLVHNPHSYTQRIATPELPRRQRVDTRSLMSYPPERDNRRLSRALRSLRIRKALEPSYQPTEDVSGLLQGYLENPSPAGRLIMADALEESGHPHADNVRDPNKLAHLYGNFTYKQRRAYNQPIYGSHSQDEHLKTINSFEQGIPQHHEPWSSLHSRNYKYFLTDLINQPAGHKLEPWQLSKEEMAEAANQRLREMPTTTMGVRPRKYLSRGRSVRGTPIRKAAPTHHIVVPAEHEIGNIAEWAPKYLNNYEKNRVKLHQYAITPQLAGLTPINDLLHVAWAGRVMKDWYHEKGEIHKILTHHPMNRDQKDLFRDIALATAFSGRSPVPVAEKGKEMLMRAWVNGATVKGHKIPARTDDPTEIHQLMMGLFSHGNIQFPKDHPLYPGQPMVSRRKTGGIQMRVMGPGNDPTKEAWAPLGGGIMKATHMTPAIKALGNLDRLMGDVYQQFSSPKYNSFYHNHAMIAPVANLAQVDRPNMITVDAWDALMKGLKDVGKEGVYHLGQAIGRHTAALSQDPQHNPHFDDPSYSSGMMGNQVQAAGWSGFRALVLKAANKAYRHLDPRELIKATNNFDVYKANSPSLYYTSDPDMSSLIKDRVAEGSLPEDTFAQLNRNAERFRPSSEELAEPISHNPDALVPMANKAISSAKGRARGEALQAAKTKNINPQINPEGR